MRATALFLFLSLVLAGAACSPARTGVNGNTLSTNSKPPVSMTANAPLALQGSGKLWVSGEVTSKLTAPLLSFDYAIFSDTPSGPLSNSAHAFLLKIQDSAFWYFAPDSWPSYEDITLNQPSGAGTLAWPSRIFKTPAAGDWISEMWQANNRAVPEYWITRHWAAMLDDTTKAIMEYREPWPACLDGTLPGIIMVDGDSGQCLHQFMQRAASAFNASAEPTALPNDAGIRRGLVSSGTTPNTLKLAGEINTRDTGGDEATWIP